MLADARDERRQLNRHADGDGLCSIVFSESKQWMEKAPTDDRGLGELVRTKRLELNDDTAGVGGVDAIIKAKIIDD